MVDLTGEPKIDAIGVVITIESDEDLASCTTKKMHFLKPDGATLEVDATIYNTNYLRYTTVSGNLDVAGDWYVTLYTVSTSYSGYSETGKFTVLAKHG